MSLSAIVAIGLLPVVWAGTYVTFSVTKRKILWLIASYAFYATYGLTFLAVLVASSSLNFLLGRFIRRNPSFARLGAGIAVNLALLSVYKYIPAAASHSRFGSVVLPIGLSFWTFQGLSYLFDLYRDEPLDPSMLEFLLYVGFAPTVLSGPICRLGDMLPQFRKMGRVNKQDLRLGAERLWLGALNIGIAQLIASDVHGRNWLNSSFAQDVGSSSALDVWAIAIGYGFYLFFNFSGYSHIAIGVARCFGVRVAENFNAPFFSTNVSSFWSRWHMSLSFWIRDYVFLPIAAIRREKYWHYAVLVMSMVVFGIWHKATLTLIAWGTYHGVLLVAHRVWQKTGTRLPFGSAGPLGRLVSWALTFGSVSLGWLFFRAENLHVALLQFAHAINPAALTEPLLPPEFYATLLFVAAWYFCIGLLFYRRSKAGDLEVSGLPLVPMELRAIFYGVTTYLVIFHAAQTESFVYFGF